MCRSKKDGLHALPAKAKDLMKSSRELWKLKQELGKVVWVVLEPAAEDAATLFREPRTSGLPAARLKSMAAEFMQAFSQESDEQGIFGDGENP